MSTIRAIFPKSGHFFQFSKKSRGNLPPPPVSALPHTHTHTSCSPEFGQSQVLFKQGIQSGFPLSGSILVSLNSFAHSRNNLLSTDNNLFHFRPRETMPKHEKL